MYNWVLRDKIERSCLVENKCSVFFSSCFVHGQFQGWPWGKIKIGGVSIQKAVSDFVVFGDEVRLFDGIFGENDSCKREDFDLMI